MPEIIETQVYLIQLLLSTIHSSKLRTHTKHKIIPILTTTTTTTKQSEVKKDMILNQIDFNSACTIIQSKKCSTCYSYALLSGLAF